jgi:glutathionyl-hydroquinone reductase
MLWDKETRRIVNNSEDDICSTPRSIASAKVEEIRREQQATDEMKSRIEAEDRIHRCRGLHPAESSGRPAFSAACGCGSERR